MPYRGATADGVISNNGVVEIKCPYSAQNLTSEEAINAINITVWKIKSNGTNEINKNHNWFYQIRRNYCILAVWPPLE